MQKLTINLSKYYDSLGKLEKDSLKKFVDEVEFDTTGIKIHCAEQTQETTESASVVLHTVIKCTDIMDCRVNDSSINITGKIDYYTKKDISTYVDGKWQITTTPLVFENTMTECSIRNMWIDAEKLVELFGKRDENGKIKNRRYEDLFA